MCVCKIKNRGTGKGEQRKLRTQSFTLFNTNPPSSTTPRKVVSRTARNTVFHAGHWCQCVKSKRKQAHQERPRASMGHFAHKHPQNHTLCWTGGAFHFGCMGTERGQRRRKKRRSGQTRQYPRQECAEIACPES